MSGMELVEDYTRTPVPDGQTVPGRQIMLVVLALGFSLPVLALGAQIARAQGLGHAAIASFAGCLLSAMIGIGPAIIGSRVRLSSYVILDLVFGPFGGRIINLVLAAILLGWFANVADLLGTSVSESLLTQYGIAISGFQCTALAIVAMTLSGIFGFHMMEKLSRVTVPILTLFMAWAIWLAFDHGTWAGAMASSGSGAMGMSNAISATIGLVILMAVLLPDFTRYAANGRAALMPAASIGLGYPIVMMMGAIPAALLGQDDLMRMMILLGIPGAALLVLILSTWVGNTGNLYCSTLTLSALLPRCPVWQLGFGGAAVTLVAAWFHISQHFVPFLEILGVAATPIAAVWCCSYFLADDTAAGDTARLVSRSKGMNTIVWFVGALAGYASQTQGGFVMPAPAIEGYLATVIIWFLVFKGPWKAAA